MAKPPPPSPAASLERPRLELSGPTLLAALEKVVSGCEQTVGVEAYVEALKLRSLAFQQTFARAGSDGPDAAQFAKLAAFMPTVRRRVGPYLAPAAYPAFTGTCQALVEARHDPLTVDERVAAFCASFPQDKSHRWVRDLAAELLHACEPERYPLMCRWVWDARANTGVLREIWHGDVDRETIRIKDNYATFIMLREELSQFLASNGVYQNVLQYVDLLCAQVYAGYVSAQGGSYLRADFSSAEDPIYYVRRLLGLDGVRAKGVKAAPAPALLPDNASGRA
jgi:hypothetical protein